MLTLLTLTAAYVLSGKIGLMLALPPGYASVIFPPAGIALASALVLGRPALPAIFAGAVILNLWVGATGAHGFDAIAIAGALSIGLASMLQAWVGRWFLLKTIGYPSAFDETRHVLWMVVLIPVACVVAATLAVPALVWLGLVNATESPVTWFSWWLGDTFGAYIFVPIVLTLIAQPSHTWRRRRLTVAVPLACACALSIFAFVKNSAWEMDDVHRDFRAASRQLSEQLQARLEAQELIVADLGGFMSREVGRPVTRQEFQRFVAPTLERFPMIQAIEWAPSVLATQRASFEAAQARAFPGFEIRDRDDNGRMKPAGHRDAYVPVTFVEPIDPNFPALGFDLISMPDRRPTVLAAMQGAAALATPPLRLVQEHGHQAGILLIGNVPSGLNAPGVVLTVLQVGDFVEKALPVERDWLQVRLVDVESDSVIYGPEQSFTGHDVFEHRLSYGGRILRLQTAPSPLYLETHRGWQRLALLAVWLFGAAMLGALLLLGTGYATRVGDLVKVRTDELARESAKNRLLLHNSSDGVHILDTDGNVLECSDSFCAMLGLTREETIGLNVASFDVHFSPEALRQVVENCFGTLEQSTVETRHHRKDGSTFDVEVSARPLELDGRLVLFAAARDVSRRKQNEAQLRKLSQAVDQSPASVIITDTSGRIEYVNDAFCTNTGYTRDEVLGLNPRILKSGHTSDAEYRTLWQNLRAGKSWSGTFHNRRKDGTLYWDSCQISPVIDELGAITHFLAIRENVTERLLMETKLRESQEALETALQSARAASTAKGSFVANMSHEIRTPLNAVIGLAHLIRRGGLNPEQEDRLGKLENAAEHLLRILNSILDLSKIEAGKFTLEGVPLRVETIVENAASILGERARAKGLSLVSELDVLPVNLEGDPTRLQQALLNYANNAIKFTDRGSVTLRVKLVAEDDSSAMLRFEVTDTGPGIAADVVTRLFSAFEQADNSITRKSGGTGLGLAITRKLAELMGGDAGVNSSPGEGSTFWFTARLRKTQTPARVTQHSHEDPAEILRREFPGARILLAEDNRINREVATALLEEAGLNVDTAEDGRIAVERAARERYDLVLMDMQMPNMDGLDASREIRKVYGAESLPIVAMTANAFSEDKERCFAAGMDAFLSKPVSPDELFTQLLEQLRRTRTPHNG